MTTTKRPIAIKILSIFTVICVMLSMLSFASVSAASSLMTTFKLSNMQGADITLSVGSNNTLIISNLPSDDSYNNIALSLYNHTDGSNFDTWFHTATTSVSFSLSTVPNGTYDIYCYCSATYYGDYLSFINGTISIEVSNGTFGFVTPLFYPYNVANLALTANPDPYELGFYAYGGGEAFSAPEYNYLKSLATTITAGTTDNYQKALKIHDWIAGYLYYDYDNFESGEPSDTDIFHILKTKRAVCTGYALLYNALCIVSNIPCNVVVGFALGQGYEVPTYDLNNAGYEDCNHIWNEVYVNNRWVIVDATWDSSNMYYGGEFTDGAVYENYFDCTVEFLATTHHAIEPYVADPWYEKMAPLPALPNGTAKTSSALGLPAQVEIVTESGSTMKSVVWDVAGSDYDPSLATEQSFYIYGTVQGLDDAVTCRVTVNAVLPPYINGDVNSDGTVDLIDVTTLSRYVAGWTLTGYNLDAADVTGDSLVDLMDVTMLSRFIAGWSVVLQ